MTTLHDGPVPIDESPLPARVVTPRHLDEALLALAGPATAVLAGGVGHTLRRQARVPAAATTLVSVAALPELDGIRWEPDRVRIGAGMLLDRVAADERLAKVWPAVTEAAGSVATARIRRLVTLGGNIAARDDSHDPPVALAAVGATLTVAGQDGRRELRVEELSELRPDEIVLDVSLPLPAVPVGSAFEKFLVRGVWEYACVNVAAVVGLDDSGTVRRLALTVGSVTGGPVNVELSGLLGGAPDEALITEAARRAAAGTRPYGDVRGSAAYKTRMIDEFARRALTRAADRAANLVRGNRGEDR